MKIPFCSALTLCSSLLALNSFAATPPYSETFEGYATGNTAVTNFTEVSTGAWTIVSPSISGKGYEDAISAFSSGTGSRTESTRRLELVFRHCHRRRSRFRPCFGSIRSRLREATSLTRQLSDCCAVPMIRQPRRARIATKSPISSTTRVGDTPPGGFGCAKSMYSLATVSIFYLPRHCPLRSVTSIK